MGNEKKERKNNLLTIRITEEEMDELEYLSDKLEKTKSDSIIRACKFLLNSGDGIDENDGDEKERKNRRVHVRITDSDMKFMYEKSDELGITSSQIVRKAIKSFARIMRNHY